MIMPEFLIAATNALCAGAAVLATYIAWWAPRMEAYHVAIKILKLKKDKGALSDGNGVVVTWERLPNGRVLMEYAGSERVRKMILEYLR